MDADRVREISDRLRRGEHVATGEWREAWMAMPVAQQRALAKRARKMGLSAMGLLREHPELCVPDGLDGPSGADGS